MCYFCDWKLWVWSAGTGRDRDRCLPPGWVCVSPSCLLSALRQVRPTCRWCYHHFPPVADKSSADAQHSLLASSLWLLWQGLANAFCKCRLNYSLARIACVCVRLRARLHVAQNIPCDMAKTNSGRQVSSSHVFKRPSVIRHLGSPAVLNALEIKVWHNKGINYTTVITYQDVW